jgi:hypothetical protein
LLPEVGEGQEKLLAAACPARRRARRRRAYLAAGIGTLGVIDNDTVDARTCSGR